MVDYQHVKITEVDDFQAAQLEPTAEQAQEAQQLALKQGTWNTNNNSNTNAFAPRTPRNIELEMRGSLVNSCLAGDVVRVVGVVQAMQLDVPKSVRFSGRS